MNNTVSGSVIATLKWGAGVTVDRAEHSICSWPGHGGSLNADILSKDEKCEDITLKLLGYLPTAANSCYQKSHAIENQEGNVNFTVSIEQ